MMLKFDVKFDFPGKLLLQLLESLKIQQKPFNHFDISNLFENFSWILWWLRSLYSREKTHALFINSMRNKDDDHKNFRSLLKIWFYV